ncbi:MAG: GNAT family N-acetyltransferase [Chloroflexota bacterium]|nr:GNAT family N-acetyltransferase [Chloroflexota bacterium]
MNIRQATTTDNFLLSSLCMDVQQLHAKHHSGIFKMPRSADFASSFFDEMLMDPATTIYIAEEDAQALGYILCKLIERPETSFTYPNRFLHIDQISVRPDAQGRGIGTALMDQVEKLARELGVSKIQLDSWDFNTKAHTFFEALGFEKFNYRFWHDL